MTAPLFAGLTWKSQGNVFFFGGDLGVQKKQHVTMIVNWLGTWVIVPYHGHNLLGKFVEHPSGVGTLFTLWINGKDVCFHFSRKQPV